MKRLNKIISRRFGSNTPSWQIVFEWENIVADYLNLHIVSNKSFVQKFLYPIINKIGLNGQYHKLIPQTGLGLYYDSISITQTSPMWNKNIIPVMIDFWLKDSDIPHFLDCYKDVPLLLVTNREVYEKLKKYQCKIPLEHWGLSMPDQYKFDKKENYNKDIEFAIIGRPNPFFIRLLDEYAKNHRGFRYIFNKGVSSNRDYYYNDGEFFAKDTGRDFYIDLIRRTKISCYTTPGLDESKRETSEYNQVTPRVFEMLCNGCQIIGHYPISADTMWYNLQSIVPNVNNYIEFEQCLDRMRSSEADISAVKSFMTSHYTSSRVITLRDILKKHNISL